jgi:hypothetical protein
LFTSDERSPEYFKDAKYKNIVTIENGKESIGILYTLNSLFSINESINVRLDATAISAMLIIVGSKIKPIPIPTKSEL